jgi:hypothetical protein
LRVLNLANEVEELETWKEGSLVTVRFRFGQVLELLRAMNVEARRT